MMSILWAVAPALKTDIGFPLSPRIPSPIPAISLAKTRTGATEPFLKTATGKMVERI